MVLLLDSRSRNSLKLRSTPIIARRGCFTRCTAPSLCTVRSLSYRSGQPGCVQASSTEKRSTHNSTTKVRPCSFMCLAGLSGMHSRHSNQVWATSEHPNAKVRLCKSHLSMLGYAYSNPISLSVAPCLASLRRSALKLSLSQPLQHCSRSSIGCLHSTANKP